MVLDVFKLNGKVALITGGSKGLGKAMATGFAAAGADVIISSRHEEELKAALPDILRGTDRKGTYVVADMNKRSDVDRLIEKALAFLGRVDILVNNAGSNNPQAIDEITDKDWDSLIELNLRSVMALTRGLVPQMKERRWGRVIHVSSILGFIGKEKRNAYCATKSALIGLAKASAIDLGPYGITVNCIAPGPFLTDLPARLLDDKGKQAFSDHTALGRWGKPEELIGPALMLASDAGSYVTGETLVVDGGFIAR